MLPFAAGLVWQELKQQLLKEAAVPGYPLSLNPEK